MRCSECVSRTNLATGGCQGQNEVGKIRLDVWVQIKLRLLEEENGVCRC